MGVHGIALLEGERGVVGVLQGEAALGHGHLHGAVGVAAHVQGLRRKGEGVSNRWQRIHTYSDDCTDYTQRVGVPSCIRRRVPPAAAGR